MKRPQTLQTASESTNLPLKYRLSSLRSKRGLIMHTEPWGKVMFFQRKSLMKLLLLQLCQPRSMWLLVLVSDWHLIQKKRKYKCNSSDSTELSEQSRVSQDRAAELWWHGLSLSLGSFMSKSLWVATGMVKACKVFWDPLEKYYL